MQCPNCHAAVDEGTIYCGNCGNQVAPLRAQGATLDYARQDVSGGIGIRQEEAPRAKMTPAWPEPTMISRRNSSQLRPPRSSGRRRSLFIGLVILLLVVLAGGTLLAVVLTKGASAIGANASGQVAFFDGTNGVGNTDALKITLNGLNAPPAGSHYDAWLVDEIGEHTMALGELKASGSNSFALDFAGNGSNGQSGTNLLGAGNVVEISLETANVQLPTGQVVLSATFPPKAFVHIRHLLFSFPTTPNKIGLLVGLLGQTKLLDAQAQALQSIAASQNRTAIACIAQSMIDISEGQQGANYQPLLSSCGGSVPVGDGFGILGTNGYAATAATHASLAATQTDTTANIRLHANEVEVGTTDITNWVTTLTQDALKLLANPGDVSGVGAIVTLADHAYHGVDTNGNGQIEALPGEAGATTSYLRGQLMATLPLVPAAG